MSSRAVSPAIGLRGVSVQFGGIVALSAVTLEVFPGEVVGLIGPNGAGKTTILDVLSGLRRPSSGSVILDDTNITKRAALWRARRGVRRTFQRQQVFAGLSVEENVAVALEWGRLKVSRVNYRARVARVDECLEMCGLGELRREPAGRLSIGHARQLELARAVADRPRVLLLDEPTSGLEEDESRKLGVVVDNLRGEGICAVVLVEHDVSFVMELCDRVVALSLGSIIVDGPPDVVRRNPEVISAYLG
jgi:branched-chain amino acid transport system ATP-binding protein